MGGRWSEEGVKRTNAKIAHDATAPSVPMLEALAKGGAAAQKAVDDELRSLGIPERLIDPSGLLLELELPMPPSMNGRLVPVHDRATGKPAMRQNDKIKKWRHAAYNELRARRTSWGHTISCPLRAVLVLHFAHGGDTDDRVKDFGDFLQWAGIVKNDSLIARWEIERGEPPGKSRTGRAVLRLYKYEKQPPKYTGSTNGEVDQDRLDP